jgi:hypothetical protein
MIALNWNKGCSNLKTGFRVTDVLTHPGNRCPEICQVDVKNADEMAEQMKLKINSTNFRKLLWR